MKHLLTALFACCVAQASETNQQIERWIESADRIELMSIESMVVEVTDFRPGAPKVEYERIHGHKILGRVSPRSKAEEGMIKSAVVEALRSVDDGPPLLCFEPREAVRLFIDDEKIDLLLCFTCKNGRAYRGGSNFMFYIGTEGYRVLSMVLDTRGIRREPIPGPTSGQSQ